MFVCGDSAGGNIAHHVAVRYGSGQLALDPVIRYGSGQWVDSDGEAELAVFRGVQGHGFFIFDPKCESRENSPQDCGGAHGGGLVGARWGGNRRRREEEEEKGRLFDEEEEEGIDLRQALALIYQGDLLPVPATSWE